MERAVVRGVHTCATAALTVVGVPDRPGKAGEVLRVLADLGVEPGLLVQRAAPGGPTDLVLTVPTSTVRPAVTALETARPRIGFREVDLDEHAALIGLTGAGLRSDPVIATTFCEALAGAGVLLTAVSFEATELSALCTLAQASAAARALREAFEVDLSVAHSGVVGLAATAR